MRLGVLGRALASMSDTDHLVMETISAANLTPFSDPSTFLDLGIIALIACSH